MIYLLTGDNTYEIEQQLQKLTAGFVGDVERVDGLALDANGLADIMAGGTLFAATRFVVVRGLSENKPIWTQLGEQLDRLSDDVTLVLIEPGVDKRTKTYKALAKKATVTEAKLWRDYDTVKAEAWLQKQSAALDPRSARALVARVGVDQWSLMHALEKLTLLDTITPEVIEQVIEASPHDNVYALLESALSGHTEVVKQTLTSVALHEDPYRVMGLLSSQLFTLTLLQASNASPEVVAQDAGQSVYMVQRLAPLARSVDQTVMRRAVTRLATADAEMKSGTELWLALELALLGVAVQ
jgi:DNA polymerase III subunit delta